MGQKLWEFMDQVFAVLEILSGENDADNISISHIL
jgi:hypothetical protein